MEEGARPNCWEAMKCGREIGGERAVDGGVCPAATERRLDGANGGKNGGRACWVVEGTLCEDRVQGSFAAKTKDCDQCDFYSLVKAEEGAKYTFTVSLLARLQEE